MLKPQRVVRWDPKARAGAVAVAPTRRLDVQAVSDLADVVMDWATYTKVAADLDNVETSRIRGNYDWRAYLQEEAEAAQGREAERLKQRAKEKAASERRPPPPPPSHLYQ